MRAALAAGSFLDIVLERSHAFTKIDEVRETNAQAWLDLVGDSAHALRGLELASANGTILY